MVFIFDLDGTLALNQHRQHFLENTPRQWDAWNAACVDDTPNKPLIWLLEKVVLAVGHHAYILTGRDEKQREPTREWLKRALHTEKVDRVPLIMRPAGDHTEDTALKARWFEVLKQLHPNEEFVAIEDRKRMVDMWRGLGLQCWQVAPGDF
jgi:hypothetical protein